MDSKKLGTYPYDDLYAGKFRKSQRTFTMTRQTVNRHIDALVERVGGAPFAISNHTFRHSFVIHLLLHGRPLKYVSQLLGHKSIDSTEIYTNVLTIDAGIFWKGWISIEVKHATSVPVCKWRSTSPSLPNASTRSVQENSSK